MMFSRQLESDVIRQPFDVGISTGSYWLTRLQSRAETSAMLAFKDWLLEERGNDHCGREQALIKLSTP
jgi:LysR family transcriptional regulator of beta-lactamase